MRRLVITFLAVVVLIGSSAGVAVALNAHAHHSVRAGHAADRFGPAGYRGVRLRMTRAQATAAGAHVDHDGKGAACDGFLLPRSKAPENAVDGWLSRKQGVAFIEAPDRTATTPEGLHEGATHAQARAAYPHARSYPDFWSVAVPGHPRESYWWNFQHGRVVTLAIVLDTQDCVN
ncbi:MAG: hypothetical protein FWE71_16590 [Nocardioidaceae bacterium]|nr:hypothetical protein [Nocardioidaceae bacterium]